MGTGDGQGGLVCCSPLDTTEGLNWTATDLRSGRELERSSSSDPCLHTGETPLVLYCDSPERSWGSSKVTQRLSILPEAPAILLSLFWERKISFKQDPTDYKTDQHRGVSGWSTDGLPLPLPFLSPPWKPSSYTRGCFLVNLCGNITVETWERALGKYLHSGVVYYLNSFLFWLKKTLFIKAYSLFIMTINNSLFLQIFSQRISKLTCFQLQVNVSNFLWQNQR